MSSALLVYAFLAPFWTATHAALVNKTIEDFSSVVQYNCSIQRCDANAKNSNPCPGAEGAVNRTIAIILPACQIKIPFTGTAVYAFLGGEAENCTFEIDNTGSHPSLRLGEMFLFTETGLAYFNNSLPNGTHTLVISGSDMSFDSVIYTFDDAPTAGLPAPSQSSSIPTTSTSPPAIASSSVIPVIKNKPPIGGIVGGVLGGLVLLAVVVALVAIFKRRSRRRLGRNMPRPIFLGDKDEVDPRPDVGPRSPDNTALAEQIRVLQSQTAELQLALRTQQGPSAGTSLSLASTKRGQTRTPVREEAPRVAEADLVLHMDSGIRFTPARQAEEVPPDYTPQ